MENLHTYPIAIIEDRYTGAYSGGRWLAIGWADVAHGHHATRVSAMLAEGPSGSDTEAMEFWDNPPNWIAAGSTPDVAEAVLRARMSGNDDGAA